MVGGCLDMWRTRKPVAAHPSRDVFGFRLGLPGLARNFDGRTQLHGCTGSRKSQPRRVLFQCSLESWTIPRSRFDFVAGNPLGYGNYTSRDTVSFGMPARVDSGSQAIRTGIDSSTS